MDPLISPNLGARRNESAAFDLLKSIPVTVGVGRAAAPSAGFSAAALSPYSSTPRRCR
jgi:hypothetical protein